MLTYISPGRRAHHRPVRRPEHEHLGRRQPPRRTLPLRLPQAGNAHPHVPPAAELRGLLRRGPPHIPARGVRREGLLHEGPHHGRPGGSHQERFRRPGLPVAGQERDREPRHSQVLELCEEYAHGPVNFGRFFWWCVYEKIMEIFGGCCQRGLFCTCMNTFYCICRKFLLISPLPDSFPVFHLTIQIIIVRYFSKRAFFDMSTPKLRMLHFAACPNSTPTNVPIFPIIIPPQMARYRPQERPQMLPMHTYQTSNPQHTIPHQLLQRPLIPRARQINHSDPRQFPRLALLLLRLPRQRRPPVHFPHLARSREPRHRFFLRPDVHVGLQPHPVPQRVDRSHPPENALVVLFHFQQR